MFSNFFESIIINKASNSSETFFYFILSYILLFYSIYFILFISKGAGASAKQVRSEQLALNELEFEWLRQFYIQGTKHYGMHKWQVL